MIYFIVNMLQIHTKKMYPLHIDFFLSFFKKDLDGKFVGCEHT